MRDAFINSVNSQQTTWKWMNELSDDLLHAYTPGYRYKEISFKSYLDNAIMDTPIVSNAQGKAMPGTSDENVFIEGKGYFVIRNEEGRLAYTRLGDFKFDGEGVYRANDGSKVQGYILNDNGEIMSGTKSLSKTAFQELIDEKGATVVPTTEIKLWKDPDNGKYLGKYESFEIKEDGVLYGKTSDGSVKTPLYKLAFMNFNNPNQLFEFKQGQFLETAYSGKPVLGNGEIKSGSIEASNVDFRAKYEEWQDASVLLGYQQNITSQCKSLTQSALDIMSST